MEASSAPQATTQEHSASDQPPTTSPKSPRIDSQGTICDDDPPPIDNTGGSAKTSPPSLSKSLYLEKPSVSPDFANAKPATCPLPSYNPPKSPTFDKPETLSHETLPKAEVHPMEFFTEPPAILGGPTPVPINQPRTIWHRILYPTGVTPHHSRYEHWIGRIGFGGKGVVYGMVGGMICASARRIYGEINGSPQGAFVLIGDFPVGGKALLVVMLMALMAYICWRWWEAFTFQGADATFSPFKNFFSYRLSPLVSGCVYVAYTYYIIEVLANHSTSVCYPDCWRETTLGHVGLALFGVAFAIACVTQLLNAFTRKWHPEMNWARCNVYEKWTLLILGHIGFLGRAGLFLFVSVLMFRVYRTPVRQSGNTIANGINQFVDSRTGRAFMYIVGTLTAAYGVFALLCTHYRFFPTPPPSGIPLFYHPRTENGSELDRSVTMRNQRVERNRQGMLRVNDNEDLAQGAASMGSGPAVVVDDVAGPSNYQTTTSTNHANKVISSVIDDVIDNVVSNNNNHNTQNSENENNQTSNLQNTPVQNNSETTIQNSPNNVILDNFSPNTTNLQNSQSKLQASAIDEVDT